MLWPIWGLAVFSLASCGTTWTVQWDDKGGPPDTGTQPDLDEDHDGFLASEDCDDTNSAVHPDAPEVCNEIDDNCDGLIDDDDPDLDATTTTAWYLDEDSDGFALEDDVVLSCSAPDGYIPAGSGGFDCDDTDATIHPGAEEADCTDPTDHNCDGSVEYADVDEDGFAACVDCDDDDFDVNPAALEVCDGIDNDCDDTTNEDDADDALTWYADADLEGYGDDTTST